MAKLSRRRTAVGLGLYVAIALLAYSTSPATGSSVAWFSIIPPLTAIVLALVFQKIHLSLFLAVMVGGLLTTVPGQAFGLTPWIDGCVQGGQFIIATLGDVTNLLIILFVVLVLGMISVLMASGGLKGIIIWLERYAISARTSQLMTAIMGLLVFIDDYANTMLVGSAMRPVTDRFKISREKLAFLVDATSAPIAGLAIISTWIGYEVGLFNEVAKSLAIPKDGYALFFDALNYRFYCLMMIIFVFVTIVSGIDFGPMAIAERRARERKDGDEEQTSSSEELFKPFQTITPQTRTRAMTAILPIIVLFVVLLGGMWVDGEGLVLLEQNALAIFQPAAWRTVFSASENSILILSIAAAAGLVCACCAAAFIAQLSAGHIVRALLAGFRNSVLPVSILILAWSLKESCDALKTGEFLALAVGSVVSPFWMPLIIFVVAGMTSFASGTSWGTMAILIPTAIPLAFALDGHVYGLTTMISLGAVLDGAIFGDHCSPISDTTIMSSIFSGCDHIQHVRTQLPYSLLVGVCALVFGYLPAALGWPSLFGLLISLSFFVLLFVKISFSRRSKHAE